jgi:hypothetical protein
MLRQDNFLQLSMMCATDAMPELAAHYAKIGALLPWGVPSVSLGGR